MRDRIRNLLIVLLFRLLGNSNVRPTKAFNVQYLFGANTTSHEARRKRWEKALARLWTDKDLLDYFFYQAESDKENVWRGKISPDLSRGARIRTLFFVYSARRAWEEMRRNKSANATERADSESEIKRVKKVYDALVDI